ELLRSSGMALNSGIPLSVRLSEAVINPASTAHSPVWRVTLDSYFLLETTGMPSILPAPSSLNSVLISNDTSSVPWTRGVTLRDSPRSPRLKEGGGGRLGLVP